MSLVSTFAGNFCNADAVLDALSKKTGYRAVFDTDIIEKAAVAFHTPKTKFEKVFSADSSAFNRFTHEREHCIAQLKQVLAQKLLDDDGLLIHGFASQLIPRKIAHNLRVCLIADLKYRVANLTEEKGLPEKQALEVIGRFDQDCAAWIRKLFHTEDPWTPSLYDIFAPTDKLSIDRITELVRESLSHQAVQPTEQSKKAVEDFGLASRVEVAMFQAGHHVSAAADSGSVELTVNRPVLLQDRLETELESIVNTIPGVKTFRVSITSRHSSMQPEFFVADMPHRIMLVDDEREFVETLSERLMTRHIPTTVTYSGEAALETIKESAPEVMILDLKMPGIDGIEVLKRVKAEHPEVEVIILTGRGTKADRDACMALGAYAYFEKPVDIEALSEAIRRVYRMGKRNQRADR